MSSKHYLSCQTLDDWFSDFESDENNWIVTEIIDNLKNGLTETNILMVDAHNDDFERLQTINSAIISALRDLTDLCKEVRKAIKKGEILEQKCKSKPVTDDDED